MKLPMQTGDRMKTKSTLLAALIVSLSLAGCVATTPTPGRELNTVSPLPAASSPSGASAAAVGIVDAVLVQVYSVGTFQSKHGCACTLPDTDQELFSVGSPVIMVKVKLTGEWKPSQGAGTSQDVTGMTLKGTKFDGRPEAAVFDTADGPRLAEAHHLPWLPAGLFRADASWAIPNDKGRVFAAAWYLPPGVDQLLLTVDIPSEGQPTLLTVPIPASAIRQANSSQE